MKSTISTRKVDVSGRSRHWHETIARAYFPLDLTFARPEAFDGELTSWDLGEVSLSRLTSDALMYRRLPKHFREPGPEEFLVTLPAKSELRFVQGGKEVRANPGAFFIERSHEPSEFSHAEAADLWVMKLSTQRLGGRIRAPDRLCSLQFDATNGANGLFVDMVHLIPARYDTMTEETRGVVGRQLVDLLALAIQSFKDWPPPAGMMPPRPARSQFMRAAKATKEMSMAPTLSARCRPSVVPAASASKKFAPVFSFGTVRSSLIGSFSGTSNFAATMQAGAFMREAHNNQVPNFTRSS